MTFAEIHAKAVHYEVSGNEDCYQGFTTPELETFWSLVGLARERMERRRLRLMFLDDQKGGVPR